jgi:hypothetical protein
MRYRLRTLLMLLAVGPPLLAALWIALTDQRVFVVLLAVLAAALYGIFTLVTAYAIAWVIATVNDLIGRLQDRS